MSMVFLCHWEIPHKVTQNPPSVAPNLLPWGLVGMKAANEQVLQIGIATVDRLRPLGWGVLACIVVISIALLTISKNHPRPPRGEGRKSAINAYIETENPKKHGSTLSRIMLFALVISSLTTSVFAEGYLIKLVAFLIAGHNAGLPIEKSTRTQGPLPGRFQIYRHELGSGTSTTTVASISAQWSLLGLPQPENTHGPEVFWSGFRQLRFQIDQTIDVSCGVRSPRRTTRGARLGSTGPNHPSETSAST